MYNGGIAAQGRSKHTAAWPPHDITYNFITFQSLSRTHEQSGMAAHKHKHSKNMPLMSRSPNAKPFRVKFRLQTNSNSFGAPFGVYAGRSPLLDSLGGEAWAWFGECCFRCFVGMAAEPPATQHNLQFEDHT